MRSTPQTKRACTSPARWCSSSWARTSCCLAVPAPRTQPGRTIWDRSSPTTAGPVSRDQRTSLPSRVPGSHEARRRRKRAPATIAVTSRAIERPTHVRSRMASREWRVESRDTVIVTGSSMIGATGMARPSAPPPLDAIRSAGRTTVPAAAVSQTHRRPPLTSLSAASAPTRNNRPAPTDQSIHAAIISLPPSRGAGPAACGVSAPLPATAVHPIRAGPRVAPQSPRTPCP